MITWQWQSFAQLSTTTLYAILALRNEVFVVEQQCVYQDTDGLDLLAWHLLGWQEHDDQPQLVAYLRGLPAGAKFAEASLGRVLTRASVRASGTGRALLAQGLQCMDAQFDTPVIRIAAQLYLQRFYESFGFVVCSPAFDEDGIPHIDMLRTPAP